MKKRIIPLVLALAMLLTLAGCAKSPTEPPAAPAVWEGEDTFVISRDGEDFVISGAGFDVTAKEVCEAYGAEFAPYDNGTEEDGKVPPIGGDIRFGMSYGEVVERLTGVKQELEPSLTLSSGYVSSYAGALTRLRFQFDVESDRLYLMGLDFMTDDPAAEWFALLEKFTQAFGEPTTPPRGDYTTPEELTAHLADGKHYAAAAWEGGTKGLALMIRPGGEGLSVSVEMKWLDLMPGMSAPETKAFEPTLAEDFTIGGAEWGAGYESVRALLGDAEELENGMRLSKKGVTFFGQKADIDYVFAKVDGAAKLNAVAVIFEPDFDKDAVVAGVSEVLGEIDKTIVSAGGAILSVEEPLWKWHDDETVGMKYLHTAAFGEYLTLTGSRPAFEITYNGLWN